MINDYEAYDYQLDMPDFTAISEDAIARVEDSADTVAEDATEALENYYDAESLFAPNPFEAAQQEKITPEEKAQLQADLIGRNDYLEMQGLALTGDSIIAENSKIAAKTMLSIAQRDVTTAQASNEHLKMIGEIEKGLLITEKNKGIALQGVTQQVLNAREFTTIQLEMDKTEAIVDSKVQEINSIYATSKSKSLKAYQDSMKSLGVDVTGYELPGT